MLAKAKKLTARKLADLVVHEVEEIKGRDVVCLDVKKLTSVTDFLVIATGSSTRHVKAVAETAIEKLKEHGKRPNGIEGIEAGEWVLVDFGDVVLHVLNEQARALYALEKLWSGVPENKDLAEVQD